MSKYLATLHYTYAEDETHHRQALLAAGLPAQPPMGLTGPDLLCAARLATAYGSTVDTRNVSYGSVADVD